MYISVEVLGLQVAAREEAEAAPWPFFDNSKHLYLQETVWDTF